MAPVGELQEVAKAETSRPGPLHQPVTRRTRAAEKPGKGRLTGDQLIFIDSLDDLRRRSGSFKHFVDVPEIDIQTCFLRYLLCQPGIRLFQFYEPLLYCFSVLGSYAVSLLSFFLVFLTSTNLRTIILSTKGEQETKTIRNFVLTS